MTIYSLYQDFFKFLENITPHSLPWETYLTSYYEPHKDFLDRYFSHFPFLNRSNLKQRVQAIRGSDYSGLMNLISVCPPEKIIQEAYEKCIRIAPPQEEPGVYLFIGFFSPDGFVMNFRKKPVICFGLERFKDFRLLRILFVHEYAHFLLNWNSKKIPLQKKWKWLLVSEGIGTYFSFLVFPRQKLSDHFLFSRDRLNWCQTNETALREIYCSGAFSSQELIDLYVKGKPEMDIPPRAGKYLGFQAVKKYLSQRGEKNIGQILADKSLAVSLEL